MLSFHCPLTPQSYHMLDARALKDCKDGVVILNTSRGALIDAQALLQGIKEEKIGAACLDVYEEEAEVFFKDISGKIPRDDVLSGLISMPNVLVTSHQAFLTKEALEAIAATTVQNLVLLSKGAACENELFYYFADTKKERV